MRWALGHLVVAAGGTALGLLGLGLGAGIGYGDIGVVGMTLAYLPACLVFAGLATALIGGLPKLAVPVTWTLLGLAIAVDLLGELRIADASTQRLISPFIATSIPLSSRTGLVTVLIALVVIVIALAGFGLAGLRRRDMDTPDGPCRTASGPGARGLLDTLDTLDDWADQTHIVLADLGYEGENTRRTCPFKTPAGGGLPVDQRAYNMLHTATRALAERGNSLLKTTFRALRRAGHQCRGGSAPSPPQHSSCSTREHDRTT